MSCRWIFWVLIKEESLGNVGLQKGRTDESLYFEALIDSTFHRHAVKNGLVNYIRRMLNCYASVAETRAV